MKASAELTAADVDELATSWINAQSVGQSSAEMVMDLQQALSSAPTTYACSAEVTAPPVAAPHSTGLLQGRQTSDVNVALESEDSGVPGASSDVQEQSEAQTGVDQPISAASREFDLEQAPAAKRANMNAQSAAEPPSRAVEVNRRAQKRFRLKQKERFQEIQARLEKTTSELLKREQMIAELRQSQQQLHRRNVILESMQQSNGRSALPSGPADSAIPDSLGVLNRQYIAQEIGESGILVLSLLGGTAQISISELSSMHITDFGKIYSSYIRTLGAAFASPRKDVQARMFTKQLAMELGHLIECVKLVNVDCFKAMIEGAMEPTLAATIKLDQAFYENLTNLLGLSPEQHEDMTYLRQLYFTRRTVLAQERQQLEEQLSSASHSQLNIPLPADRLTEMSSITAQLQHVAEEDCRVYFRSMTAMRRKIATAEQVAMACVHCYPYMLTGEQWFGAYQSPTCHKTREEIAAAASSNDMRAEWEDLEAWLAEPSWEGQPAARLSQRLAFRKSAPQQSYGALGSRAHSLYSASQNSIPMHPIRQTSGGPSGGPQDMFNQQLGRRGRALLSLNETSGMPPDMYSPALVDRSFGGPSPAPNSTPRDVYHGSMHSHDAATHPNSRSHDMLSHASSSSGGRSHDMYSHEPVSIPGDQPPGAVNSRLRQLFTTHLNNISQNLFEDSPGISPGISTTSGHSQSTDPNRRPLGFYNTDQSNQAPAAGFAHQSSATPGLFSSTTNQRTHIPPAISAGQGSISLGSFNLDQSSPFLPSVATDQSSLLGLPSPDQTPRPPPPMGRGQSSQLELFEADHMMSQFAGPLDAEQSSAAQASFGLDPSSGTGLPFFGLQSNQAGAALHQDPGSRQQLPFDKGRSSRRNSPFWNRAGGGESGI